jgi:peptidyl-dipeptidase A
MLAANKNELPDMQEVEAFLYAEADLLDEGDLHACSIYGSKAAGESLQAMLQAGASDPWPDTLEKLTGTREMDASAIIDYFQPLMGYLQEQNKGRSCGW